MAEKKDKYLVLKLADIHEYLTREGVESLEEIAKYIVNMRESDDCEGAPKYIICNQDEPYAEDVWQAILTGEAEKENSHA